MSMITIKNTDTWVVLSPRRTGSLLICSIITGVYLSNNISLKWISDIEKYTEVPEGAIIHTHYTDILFCENTKYVISYRNPIDISLSNLIRPYLDEQNWHVHKTNLSEKVIKPFNLPPNEFIDTYIKTLEWYISIPKEFLSKAKFIDYADFENNPPEAIPSILELPSIDKNFWNYTNQLVKNPGPHKLWIHNWDQIENIINSIKLENDTFINYFSENNFCDSDLKNLLYKIKIILTEK